MTITLITRSSTHIWQMFGGILFLAKIPQNCCSGSGLMFSFKLSSVFNIYIVDHVNICSRFYVQLFTIVTLYIVIFFQDRRLYYPFI